jgi:hypothetical protein
MREIGKTVDMVTEGYYCSDIIDLVLTSKASVGTIPLPKRTDICICTIEKASSLLGLWILP